MGPLLKNHRRQHFVEIRFFQFEHFLFSECKAEGEVLGCGGQGCRQGVNVMDVTMGVYYDIITYDQKLD